MIPGKGQGITLGVIADDFTGATDVASMLVRAGMRTVQVIGVPEGAAPDADAVVVALKTVRPVSGNAGVTSVKAQPVASISASSTGPMLPAGVESKVEQTLK